MSLRNLHYLIPKLSTKYFGLFKYDMALLVRVLGIQEKIRKHFLKLGIHVFVLNQPSKGEKRLHLFVSFDSSPIR